MDFQLKRRRNVLRQTRYKDRPTIGVKQYLSGKISLDPVCSIQPTHSLLKQYLKIYIRKIWAVKTYTAWKSRVGIRKPRSIDSGILSKTRKMSRRNTAELNTDLRYTHFQTLWNQFWKFGVHLLYLNF